MSQQVIITVTQDGATEIEVKGVKGKGCKDLTKGLEQSLGVVDGDRLTPEYHERGEGHRVYH